jgi:hypothetical protein
LLVVSTVRTNFTRIWAVVVPGAGIVARNTAHSTIVSRQVSDCLMRKIIITRCAVGLKRDSRKRIIALVGILRIVANAGSS